MNTRRTPTRRVEVCVVNEGAPAQGELVSQGDQDLTKENSST